ncbi:phosphoribosyl-AMP cyclohydrolase [Paracoccus angustae]|uniref:phosphoribosyl-AMP cyclohydrolase n=1 Tax=Paracoccus angustae TaxID=1671480 RepID=A0ABV7U884_9RHOB
MTMLSIRDRSPRRRTSTSRSSRRVGVMNAEALRLSIQTGQAHYWSRSRKTLWHKGATSGLVQTIAEMRIDDDQDAVWLRVRIAGGASCHVGYRSCFYRAVPLGPIGAVSSRPGLARATFSALEAASAVKALPS